MLKALREDVSGCLSEDRENTQMTEVKRTIWDVEVEFNKERDL